MKGGSQYAGHQKGTGQNGRNAIEAATYGECGAGGGGGGYWGVFANTETGKYTESGGGGGSGFLSGIHGCSTVLEIEFTSGKLKSGNETFLSPSGLPIIGREGDGYVRITSLEYTNECHTSNKFFTYLLIMLL